MQTAILHINADALLNAQLSNMLRHNSWTGLVCLLLSIRCHRTECDGHVPRMDQLIPN